jgi:photosystem II stability/assembly factor-like uncharacterized protein
VPGDLPPDPRAGLQDEPDFDEHAGRADLAGRYLPDDPALLGLRRPTFGVTGPGLAAVHAAGDRAPRRAADASAITDPRLRHSWRPTGPRNVAGRVRALAADPRDPATFYVGTASGGVYRTTDAGQRWFPLWHDEPSLAVAALGVAATSPAADPGRRRVYAATGEIVDNGFPVPGHGVWVSDNGGADWTNHSAAVPPAANPPARRGFDAIAVDPVDDDHCWVVGTDGAFRTTDGGRTWRAHLEGTALSDVTFSDGRVYLARAASAGGEAAVLRLDPPAATSAATTADVDVALASADALSIVLAPLPAGVAWPARLKLAVAPSARDVAYVRVSADDDRDLGVFRSRNARAAPARTMTWQRLAGHPDFVEEGQGTYNLCLAVSPADPNHVATGMVDVHVSTNANAADPAAVTWRRASSWELHEELRGFHADHHQLLFTPPALWLANDGGVARSTNWLDGAQVPRQTPLPAPRTGPPAVAGSIRFSARDNGISASQAYDLNQSPLVPTLHAAGFQDNGVHLTGGGPTWRAILGGDGGFVLFDADDPFRCLVTWQGGIEALQFPGHLDRHHPDEQPPGPVPVTRLLGDGFRNVDGPAFVADTDRHRTRTGRLLHTRRNRVYGTRSARGERWDVEGVGASFEVIVTAPGGTAEVEVLPTGGAVRLGLLPGRVVRRRANDPLTDLGARPAIARVTSRLPAPFRLTDGDEVALRIGGTPVTARFRAADVGAIGGVTLAEVLRTLAAALPAGAEVLPRLWPVARALELITRGHGAGEAITLGGSALAPQADGLARLGVNAGTYRGDDDRPASLTLGFEGVDEAERAVARDLRGTPPLQLTVAVGGRPARTVTFAPPAFADPAQVTAGELAAALQTALVPDSDLIDVVATSPAKAVLLTAAPGRTLVLRGTAADRLGMSPTSTVRAVLGAPSLTAEHRRLHRRNAGSIDLTPPGPDPLAFELTDGTTSTGPLPVTAGDVGNLRAVTVEELHRLLRIRIAATPGLAVEAELVATVQEAQAREIRFADARPDEAWVGGDDGRLFRTDDDGRTWAEVSSTQMRLADARVEAIAPHPTDPRIAYAGLWRLRPGPADRPLLFRTADAGATWQAVGSSRSGGALVGVVADGAPARIHALELDPADPSTVFAATDAGVFRSPDEGATWAPANEGLPHCRVVDLAAVPGRRLLRASLWGRGAWERALGSGPPDDVRLLVRTSELDDGSGPTRLAPALFADTPGADPLQSPDIKVVRRRPAALGADPDVDGVGFDLDVGHDEVVTGGDAEILVQVSNRGSFAAPSTAAPPSPPAGDASVTVVVLWAPVRTALPPLPSGFWGAFAAGQLEPTEGAWTRAGIVRLPRPVEADSPSVVGIPVTWPAAVDGTHVALLALVTATSDALDRGPLDVAELVRHEAKAALRRVPVRRGLDDRTLLLRSTDGGRFTVTERPAPATGLGAALGIAPSLGTAAARLVGGALGGPTFALAGTEPGVIVSEDPVAVDVVITNDRGEFVDLAAAAPGEVAAFVQARLAAAGVAAVAYPARTGIRLRALGDARVRITGGDAAARLGWAPMAPAAAVQVLDARNVDWFDLRGDRELRLEVLAQAAATLVVTLPSRAFDEPQFAAPDRLALLLTRAIDAAHLDGVLRCEVIRGIGVAGLGEAVVTVTGAAATAIGLAATPARFVEADPGPVDLRGDLPLRIEVVNRVTVRFDRDPDLIPSLPAAAPPDVRRAFAEAFEQAGMHLRAEVPFLALSVRASAAEGATGARTGGGHLAEIATSGIAAAGDPAALFDARRALDEDRLQAGAANHLYVRVRNAGNIDAAAVRLRLLRVDAAAAPVALAPAVATTAAVAAETVAVVDLTHTPTAGPGGAEHLLAVADVDEDGRRVDVPASFADRDALVAFAAGRLDVALRTFGVTA